MKTVGSHPGAGIFRFTVVVILVLILMFSFLYYTAAINQRTEEVARDQMIASMKQALSMMLYDYAIKGQLKDLQIFDRENPFVPLAIYRELPANYHGTISNQRDILEYGWYFDLVNKLAVYRFSDDELPVQKYKMVFDFEDLDGNGIYGTGDVGYLDIEEA